MVKPKADRACQFAPFDALKGFREALHEKERIIVPKKDLSEDQKELLDYQLHQLQIGTIVTVTYFCDGHYEKITGMVSEISPSCRMLSIVRQRISFDDIVDITIDCNFFI